MGCFIFTDSLQEIMFQIKLIGYSENREQIEVGMRERGSKKGGAFRSVCGELYVLSGHVRQRIPPMFVTLLWQYLYSYY